MAEFNERLGFKKLGTDNYGPWHVQIRQCLVIKGCAKAVDFNHVPARGEQAAPTMVGRNTPPVTLEEDEKARAYILLGVEEYHLPALQGYDNANAIWHALKRAHAATCVARQLQLKQLMTTLRKADGEPVSKYMARARELRDKLITSGHSAISDYELALSILAGLPTDYGTFVQVMKYNLTPRTTISELEAQLLTAEHDANKKSYQKENDADAFYGRLHSGGAAGAPHDGQHMQQSMRSCWHCGKTGHIKAHCPGRYKGEFGGTAIEADIVFYGDCAAPQ